MSKVESPFHIGGDTSFRFVLTLESRSVEAHSLMDSGDFKEIVNNILNSIIRMPQFRTAIEARIYLWKENHK